jgi:hypothetical protein
MATIRDHVNPDDFKSQVRVDSVTYPFFELEDGGGFIGYGHIDTRDFADALAEFWNETDPDGEYDDAQELVEHHYGVMLEESDGYWHVETEIHGEPVTAVTEHSFPITSVLV